MKNQNCRNWEYYNGIKVSPKFIDKLYDNEIIVVGTNEAGIHGAGAALQAVKDFGAKYGVGFGPQGKTFAIPTKDWTIKTLPLEVINHYVLSFISYTLTEPKKIFLVTEIGCGLAGYKPESIAPMFEYIRMTGVSNITLPESFNKILGI